MSLAVIVPVGVEVAEAFGPGADLGLLPEEDAALGAVSPSRRRDFTSGRVCARRALAKLGVAPVPILSGPIREPQWPAGIVGSITHYRGYCAAAVGWRDHVVSVGIDATLHTRLPRGVFAMISLPPERRWLPIFAAAGVCWDAVLFSAKETVYKAWFPIAKRWLGFKDAIVTPHPETQTFTARLLVPGADVGGRTLTGFHGHYTLHGDWVLCAVAVSSSERSRPGDCAVAGCTAGAELEVAL